MARPLRIEYEGALYHITARGNERKRIYFGKADYERFKKYLSEAEIKYGILLHCYILMSNHYHLVLETPEGNLSKVMHFIHGSYTTYVNITRKRSGHLFQGRYKAIVVDKDNHLLELSRYIHLNPVRAGMVKKPEDYSYSSYRSYISNDKDEIVTQEFILGMLSGKEADAKKRYKRFVESAIGVELESPLKGIYGGMILGGERFIKDILKKLNNDSLNKEDVSHRKALKAAIRMEDILATISKQFNISEDELLRANSGEMRKIAIYMIKKHTGTTNKHIGELFGGISYSAVAKTYQRFINHLREDKSLRRKVSEIENEMSYVKG